MATTLEELQILITSETSGLKKELAKVKNDLSGTEKEVNKATKGISSTLKKLGVVLAGVFAVKKVIDFGRASVTAANDMAVHEAKLATIMRQRMNATDDTIKAVKNLIAAQEAIGVVDVVAQTAAAQELSTYLSNANSLKTLVPTLNNLVAQQYGLSASAEQATGMATMLGKVMDGQVGALSRYGFTFSKAEEKILKYGNEAERVALLSRIVKDSIGDMNEELGKTPQGQMKQLSYTIDAIKTSIGAGLMSAIQAVMPYLNAMANTLLKAAQYFQMLMSAIFGTAQMSTAAAGAAISVADAQTEAGDAAEKAGKKAKRSVAGFDQLNVIADKPKKDSGKDSGGGIGAMPNLDMPKVDTESIPAEIKKMVDNIKGFIGGINFKPLIDSFDKLKTAIAPLTETFFSGLRWLWDNILVPFGTWSIQSFIPAFLDLLAGAITLLTPTIQALMSVGAWLWDEFLQPIASWTGGVIVSVLTDLGDTLKNIGDWMSNNQSTVNGITKSVGLFFAAWKVIELLAFIQMAGGVAGAFSIITGAIWAATGAKIVNAAQTVILTGMYAKDLVVSIGASIVALGRQALAWGIVTAATITHKAKLLLLDAVIVGQFIKNMALSTVELVKNAGKWVVATAAMVANKIALAASTVAQIALTAATIAWNVAAGIGAAVTTAFGVAVAILSSPITLIIAAIALLVAGIILLVKNWDTVKAVASNVWEGIKKTWTGVAEWFKTNITNPIGNLFVGMFNGIIDGVNWVIRALNKISFDFPDWIPGIGGKSFGISISELSHIPKLDVGTNYVAKDGLAFIHEGEAVVPKKYNPAASGGDNKEVIAALNRVERAINGIKNVKAVIGRDEVGKAATGFINSEYRRGNNPLPSL